MNKVICKIISLVVVTTALIGCLSGCLQAPTGEPVTLGPLLDEDSYVEGMERVDPFHGSGFRDEKFVYWRDVVTDVMYVAFKFMNAGGMTVMLDPETGLPLTYARYLELAGTVFEEG